MFREFMDLHREDIIVSFKEILPTYEQTRSKHIRDSIRTECLC